MIIRALTRAWLLSVILYFALAAPPAQAFVDPPILVPPNPIEGQEISVSIHYGGCDAFAVDEPPTVSQNGTAIVIVLEAAVLTSPLCVLPPLTFSWPVGVFPPGNYSLQVDRHYVTLDGDSITETIGNIDFTVARAYAPVPVPATQIGSLLYLVVGIGTLAWFAYKRRRQVLLMALLALSGISIQHSYAQPNEPPELTLVQVLVSTEPGAPTPEQIIKNLSFSPPPAGPPPLQAFSILRPQSAAYLLPFRAEGDFLAELEANPDSPRAVLERYMIFEYSPDSDMDVALSSLNDDPYVLAAYRSEAQELSSARPTQFSSGALEPFDVPPQYGWDLLNVGPAWQLAGGYAVVGLPDSGLAVNHLALRQFSGTGQYLGGNSLGGIDVGRYTPSTPVVDYNVDEQEPEAISINSVCNPDHLPAIPPTYAGHGTHTAGLIAANSSSPLGVKGTCKHCGIAAMRVVRAYCYGVGNFTPTLSLDSLVIANTLLAQTGAQVISMSFGNTARLAGYCASNPLEAWCLSIKYAVNTGVALVAASGNGRTRLQFPANDGRAIAAGGIDSTSALWDDSPGSNTFCPPGYTTECGSNYTTVPGEPRQELMASAKSVISTTYPNVDWNPILSCGDSLGTPMGDGIGFCTGTSMSTPQVAGIVGLLRSINPLVLSGDPVPVGGQPVGLRAVLAQTTDRAQIGLGWNDKLGYGIPDAADAARRMLGKVAGVVVKNRVTALFRFYGAVSKDFADTTSPQYATALAINSTYNYQTQGTAVPGYSTFPIEPTWASSPTPRANVYVLTTEYSPRASNPTLVPLYLVSRVRAYPVGCTTGAGCNLNNRDLTLLTTAAELELAHAAGYDLTTIQGYIYAPCSPEPACIPPGAQQFYRACKVSDDDCATFLESERAGFEAAGYTAAYPSGSNKRMGYAYPATDTDCDGLINGFEYVIGTSPFAADSDGDGITDDVEFPMKGVALSDPCAGGMQNCANIIFRHGFDSCGQSRLVAMIDRPSPR